MNETPSPSHSPAASTPTRDAAHDSVAIPADLYCPKCAYNLRGLRSDRCPECGYDITLVRLGESQLPWVHRREIGVVRAYWKTVWMVMFRSEQFGLEICRPIDEHAARRFRLVTVLHAYVPFVLLTILWALAAPKSFQSVASFAGYPFIGAIHLGIFTCIMFMSALPFYAVHHRDIPLIKRHRAAVLSLYSCAPLAWMFLVALCGAVGVILTAKGGDEYEPPLAAVGAFIAAGGLLFAILGAILMDLDRGVRRMLRDSRPVWWIRLKLDALWLVGVFLILIGIPLAYLFLAVVFYSLA